MNTSATTTTRSTGSTSSSGSSFLDVLSSVSEQQGSASSTTSAQTSYKTSGQTQSSSAVKSDGAPMSGTQGTTKNPITIAHASTVATTHIATSSTRTANAATRVTTKADKSQSSPSLTVPGTTPTVTTVEVAKSQPQTDTTPALPTPAPDATTTPAVATPTTDVSTTPAVATPTTDISVTPAVATPSTDVSTVPTVISPVPDVAASNGNTTVTGGQSTGSTDENNLSELGNHGTTSTASGPSVEGSNLKASPKAVVVSAKETIPTTVKMPTAAASSTNAAPALAKNKAADNTASSNISNAATPAVKSGDHNIASSQSDAKSQDNIQAAEAGTKNKTQDESESGNAQTAASADAQSQPGVATNSSVSAAQISQLVLSQGATSASVTVSSKGSSTVNAVSTGASSTINGTVSGKAAPTASSKLTGSANTVNATQSNVNGNSPSSNGSSNSNLTSQGSQADATQVAGAGAKSASTDNVQILASTHAASHDATASKSTSGESGVKAATAGDQLAQAEKFENATATSGVNTANVLQKMSESEMRVGMHSAEFGDISIRTSVSQMQMTAQISVDHGDLGKALSAHIPAMEAKLGTDLGVRASVEVSQSGTSTSGDREQSSQRQQKSYIPAMQSETGSASSDTDYTSSRIAATTSIANSGYRLDIRA